MASRGFENRVRNFCYLRVSTDDQDLEKFKNSVLRFANDNKFGTVKFVEEKISGRLSWKKRGISTTIDEMEKNDRLILPELSRLGRSTLEVLEILKAAKSKGINVYSIKENLSIDESIQSKIITTMLALFSELERDFISKRTKEALQARKKAGIRLGRPKGPGKSKLDSHRDEIVALLRNGSTKVHVAKRYHTTPANLYNWIRKNNLDVSVHI